MPLMPVRSPVGPRSVTDQMETQAASQKKKIGLNRKTSKLEASGHILSLGSTYSDSSLRRSGRDCARDSEENIFVPFLSPQFPHT